MEPVINEPNTKHYQHNKIYLKNFKLQRCNDENQRITITIAAIPSAPKPDINGNASQKDDTSPNSLISILNLISVWSSNEVWCYIIYINHDGKMMIYINPRIFCITLQQKYRMDGP